MKKFAKKILIACLVVFSFQVKAQNIGLYWNNLSQKSNRLQGKLTGENYYISSLANSHFFLQKEWGEGKIILEDGDIFDAVQVRYLAQGDELISYNNQLRTLFIVDKEKVKEFVFNDDARERKFVKKHYDGILKGSRYFEELYFGTRSLLAYHNVETIKVSPFTDRSGVIRDIEYRLSVKYYMYSRETGFERIQKRRRSFKKAFPERKKEIRKVFRQNSISLLSESGLVNAFSELDKAGIFN